MSHQHYLQFHGNYQRKEPELHPNNIQIPLCFLYAHQRLRVNTVFVKMGFQICNHLYDMDDDKEGRTGSAYFLKKNI